jgi:hypothetical protein
MGACSHTLVPGIVSYQASSLLTFPALLIVLVWLRRGGTGAIGMDGPWGPP